MLANIAILEGEEEEDVEHADEILTALAKRCKRKSWDTLWNSEGKNFHLLLLENDLEDDQTQPTMLDMVQVIDKKSSKSREFHYFWSFAPTSKQKRISTFKAAKKISRNVIAKATLKCLLEDLSRGYSFGFFMDIFSQTPRVFLEAGTSIEKLVMTLQLEGYLEQKA